MPKPDRKATLLKTGTLFWEECELISEEPTGMCEVNYRLRCPLCGEGEIVRWKDHTPGYKESEMTPCKHCGLGGDGSFVVLETAHTRDPLP